MLPQQTSAAVDRSNEALRYLQFAAYCLKHALLEIHTAPTTDTGLRTAYPKYLLPLRSLGGLPGTLHAAINVLLLDIGAMLGVHSASTGRATGAALECSDVESIAVRLRAIAGTAAELMARITTRHSAGAISEPCAEEQCRTSAQAPPKADAAGSVGILLTPIGRRRAAPTFGRLLRYMRHPIAMWTSRHARSGPEVSRISF